MEKECVEFVYKGSSGCINPQEFQIALASFLGEMLAYLVILIVLWHFTHFLMRWFVSIFPHPKPDNLPDDEAEAFLQYCKNWFRNN